jgi:hypothetical protein
MEKYQLLQDIFGWLSLALTIAAAISGFCWNYYGGVIDDIRTHQQIEVTEKSKDHLIEKIDSSSNKITKKIDAVSKKTHPQTVNTINAPNAQIVTSGQSGGTNVVVTNADLDPAVVNIQDWSIKNQMTTKIKTFEGATEIGFSQGRERKDSVYYNKIGVNYTSHVGKLKFVLLIKRKDIIEASFYKSPGITDSRGGATTEGYKVFSIRMPDNGRYELNIYTKGPITDLMTDLVISE